MVQFHDRRNRKVEAVSDLIDRLPIGSGDTVGKHVIKDRFVVVGHQTEQGRRFMTYEALDNGRVVLRSTEGHERRYQADREAEGLAPTSTYSV